MIDNKSKELLGPLSGMKILFLGISLGVGVPFESLEVFEKVSFAVGVSDLTSLESFRSLLASLCESEMTRLSEEEWGMNILTNSKSICSGACVISECIYLIYFDK